MTTRQRSKALVCYFRIPKHTHNPKRPSYSLWFEVGVQSFQIGSYYDTRREAVWMRNMMIKALMNFLKIEGAIK